jgi:hypothetical protein
MANLTLSSTGISSFASAASDLFAAQGDKTKAKYDFSEAQNYGLASDLATQNEKFTETSTAIKEAQQQRESLLTIGGQQADVASAGFAESGSALDLLRSSASQGALTHAVIGQQGLITEEGYKEQAASYQIMQGAATDAANAENNASTFATVTGIIKGVAAVASLATGMPDISSLFTGDTGFTPELPSDSSNPLVINQYGSPGPAPNLGSLGPLY